MENQFSLCISFFICEAEDVNFLPAFINALKRRGGGKSILYSSGCILMLGFGSDRNFFPTECFSMRNGEFTTARSFSVLCKF